MEPEQRMKREITYKAGWKREKIKIRNNNPAVDETVQTNRQNGVAPWLAQTMSGVASYMWRSAGTLPERYLYVAVWALPAFTFAISLWLVYQLNK